MCLDVAEVEYDFLFCKRDVPDQAFLDLGQSLECLLWMMQQVEFSKEAFQKVHFRLGDGIKIFKNHRLIEFQQGEERGVMCDESLQEEVVARFDIGDQRLRLFGK